MKKKLFSIALIVVLISFTVAPFWGYSCFVYAADDSASATDEEKLDASLSTYFNYRGGYFVASAGGPAVALQMVRNYIYEFYESSANTTGINSTSDFLAHVTFRNSNDHWGIYIDNNGVVFLDHLVKWLLGKDEFPNLYSGGSWGEGDTTNDNLYDGYINGNSLFYILKEASATLSGQNYYGNASKANTIVGSAWNGYDYSYLKNYYDSLNQITVDYDSPYKVGTYGSAKSISVNGPADSSNNTSPTISRNLGILQMGSGNYSVYSPCLFLDSFIQNNRYPQGVIYGNRGDIMRGNICLMKILRTNNPPLYAFGIVTYSNNNNNYYYQTYYVYSNHDYPSGTSSSTVDFETDQFDKNDVGSESGTAPGVEFVPKEETENNTYNYYNYNDYSEKQFIENYVEKYVVKKTIIDGSSQDPGDNPGGGGGGSVTPGTGSGSITPDGNGGYNFNLPDIGWPDFSGFDFNISGLSEKFPFSIPFDLMAFFTVLNAEPETPEIQGDIDLGIVNWEIDWNLHDFDGLAALLRNLEFIGFCISLILITRSIIKG